MTAATTSWGSQSRAFIGSARVHIRDLHPEDNPKRSRCGELDQKNVERLIGLFTSDKCRRFEHANRIPVVLSDTVLRRVLARNCLTIEELRNEHPPAIDLDNGTSLTYLRGRHRLAAAEQFLEPNDQRWGVYLYRSRDLPENVRRDIREHNDSSRKVDDGITFRNIRHYQVESDKEQAARWLATWSHNPSKVRDFHQLQNNKGLHKLKHEFDRNLPYPGLWMRLKMGTLHRVLTMRCHEESAHYLFHNANIWRFIAGEHAQYVDAHTVECLQGRSPFYSTSDRQFILDAFKTAELFSSISEPRIRAEIQERVCSVKCIIPSLYCFLENTKILEPPSKVLRQLLPPKFRGTIRQGLRKCYVQARNGQLRIQRDEDRFYRKECASSQFGFWSAYRDIWLFAIRNYPDMTAVKPRRGKIPATRHGARSTAECWSRLGLLATRIGFTSKKIRQLVEADADDVVAKDALAYARPAETYGADRRDLENGVQGVKLAIQLIRPHTVEERYAFLTHEGAECWRLEERCGRTYEQAFYSDRCLYFLKHMYEPRRKISPKSNITSFAVARDIFHAFFGARFQETDTSGALEDGMLAENQPVSPSEASPSEVQFDHARQTSPMLISPTESSQLEGQPDDARQAWPMLMSLSPTEASPSEAQFDDARQASPVLTSQAPAGVPQTEAETYARLPLPRLVTENTGHESLSLQTVDDALTFWEDDGSMLASSPDAPLQELSDAIGPNLDPGSILASETAEFLVPARCNSGSTMFPGPDSCRVIVASALSPAPVPLDVSSVHTAFPAAVLTPAISMIEAPPGLPYSAGSLIFKSTANENVESVPPTASAFTAPDIAMTNEPLGVFPVVLASAYTTGKTREAVFSETAAVRETALIWVNEAPPAPLRNTVFPGRLQESSFTSPRHAELPSVLLAAQRLPFKPPTGTPSDVFVLDRPSASVDIAATSVGTHQPRGVSEVTLPHQDLATEMVGAFANPPVESAVIGVDLSMPEAPVLTSQARNTAFPGSSLTPPTSPVDIAMEYPEQGFSLGTHSKSRSSNTRARSGNRVSSPQRRYPVLDMSHREAEKGKEPTKKVQKRAREPNSVTEKVAMFESKPSKFRTTLMPGLSRPAARITTQVPQLISENDDALSFQAGKGTANSSENSIRAGRPPINLSNNNLSPKLKTPQHYAIKVLENGTSKARVLEGSPTSTQTKRPVKRPPVRKAVLRHSYTPALPSNHEARYTLFPGQFLLPSSPVFAPVLRRDLVLSTVQIPSAQQADALADVAVGRSTTSTALQRFVARDERDGLSHIPSRTTLMPGTHALSVPVIKTSLNNYVGTAVVPTAGAANSIVSEEVDQHFQDELRLLEAQTEDVQAGSDICESDVEDMKTLNNHFDFLSSVEEEKFVRVKYHVPVGILIKFFIKYQQFPAAARPSLGSLVIILREHAFDCTFYSGTKAGKLAVMDDLIDFSSRSASYFYPSLQSRRYLPQQNIGYIKTSFHWGFPLIVHFNNSSFRNEIDFGERDIQDLSIRGELAIPLWDTALGKWKIYHPG